MVQVKKLDFPGQTIFCGVDVHMKSWNVCLRIDAMELVNFSQPASSQTLANYLKKNYPKANFKVTYEAGFCGFHIQRSLKKLGIDCMVAHPADVPTTDKEKQRKSDKIDCRKLSKSLSAGMLTSIFVPDVQQQDDRCIIRNYLQFVKDQTRCKNRIKGWLYFQGIELDDDQVTGNWAKSYLNWLKSISFSTASAKVSLDLLIHSHEFAHRQVLDARKELKSLSLEPRYKNKIELIRSIPGIGRFNALLFLTEIGDINRFKSFDRLCSYVGSVPNMHSSGENERINNITNRGHPKLRESIIESSWCAIRKDPALTMAFSEYSKRMKKNKAIIKIARKLLNRIRYVIKHETPYAKGILN